MQRRHQRYGKRLFHWAEKWRWLILAAIGLSLLWVEVQEFMVLRVLDQPFHYFEVFQYAILLTSTGMLIELYARSNRAHRQALQLLAYKHQLSLELAAHEDWEAVTARLVELPGQIAEVDEAYLLVGNSLNDKFEIASHRVSGAALQQEPPWDPMVPCETCLRSSSGKSINFHRCRSGRESAGQLVYSLGILDPELSAAVLKFRLAPGADLRREERELFTSIADEIAVALRASQQHRRAADLHSAQVAIAERRTVSAYVHDQLGQNLGFLHLKLDQLVNDPQVEGSPELSRDLYQLQGVANESYEIVRDILKKIQPDTVPHLTNILREHARKISRRAGFALQFRGAGRQVSLQPEPQQLILHIFYEVLNNIEKHARADQVAVTLAWRKRRLEVCISDNGGGFDPRAARAGNHYGLTILHERIEKLGGCVSIESSPSGGTRVSFSVPLHQTRESTR